jgi:hypothetical protein
MNAEQLNLLKQLAQMGDVVLITEGNKIHLDENAKVPLQTQADAVLYFLQRLDVDMIGTILEEQRTYQDFNKAVFIKKLAVAIDLFIENGNTYLNRHEGFCNSKICNFNCKGFSFIGNKSGHYFDLIIDIKDGVVHDIYECTSFESAKKEKSLDYRIPIDDDPF